MSTGVQPDVALVTMPFAPAAQPSLALSLLQASLDPGRAKVFYENLHFASLIGFDRYDRVIGRVYPSTHLVGEWLFAEAAFGPDRDRDDAYVAEFLTGYEISTSDPGDSSGADMCAAVLECRAMVDPFLDGALDRVLGACPTIVGFTSVFQQQVASLALARRIKEVRPDVTVVFGGANCEGPMGRAVLRNFPYVDVVVSGEGEVPFGQIVECVADGSPPDGIAGVTTPRDLAPLSVRSGDRPASIAMDDLPIPDFGDFFQQWSSLDVPPNWTPSLLFESARGCWWGERRHCTFCGLNGEGMSFRSKSPERAVAELCELTSRHPGLAVYAIDNIMDRDYFETFLPQLAASTCDARIFYEVKANLTKHQLRRLHDAGVRDIQPGIESLHDSVLRTMRKGVTAIQNVQLLKWCKELGIRPYWNLLWGFPGEPRSGFDEMTALIPRIAHLCPPGGIGAIRLDRFSPNFEQPEEFGFDDVRPVPAYRSVYGLPDDELAELAYFYTFDDRELRDAAPHIAGLEAAVASWRSQHPDSDLWATDNGEVLVVWDTRGGIAPTDTRLSGLERALYLACDGCLGAGDLARSAGQILGTEVPVEVATATIGSLVDAGLVMTDGRRFLALAHHLGDRPVPNRFLVRFALDLTAERRDPVPAHSST